MTTAICTTKNLKVENLPAPLPADSTTVPAKSAPTSHKQQGPQTAQAEKNRLTPVSGAWSPNDPSGERLFASLGPLQLENGGILPNVQLAYESWGKLNATASNAILIEHALTGDSHARGDAGPGHPTAGWWSQCIGPGLAIDTNKFFVICMNALGGCQGSTGPASLAPDGRPWGSRFPIVTVRDQIHAEHRLAKWLGISRWHTIIGGSMGGHRALEWATTWPTQVSNLVVVASGAATTAEQAAWTHTQIAAIKEDPNWCGGDYYTHKVGPTQGLKLARRIAHTTYRSPIELQNRFGRLPQHSEDPLRGGRLAVQSYLDHHGDKLAARFDAGSYVTLSQTLLTHDLGRNRGGVRAALAQIRARTLAIAVDSDRLFFPSQSWEIAVGVPAGTYREIHSVCGHDGFLIESSQLEAILKDFFAS